MHNGETDKPEKLTDLFDFERKGVVSSSLFEYCEAFLHPAKKRQSFAPPRATPLKFEQQAKRLFFAAEYWQSMSSQARSLSCRGGALCSALHFQPWSRPNMITIFALFTVLSAATYIRLSGLSLHLVNYTAAKTIDNCSTCKAAKPHEKAGQKHFDPSACFKQIDRLEFQGFVFGTLCGILYAATMIGLMQSWSPLHAAAASLGFIAASSYSVYCSTKKEEALIKIEAHRKTSRCAKPEQTKNSKHLACRDHS